MNVIKKGMSFILAFLFVFYAFAIEKTESQETRITIVCIGDSHFESGSPLTWFLQNELGRDYRIISAGRRGWTTGAWRRNIHIWRYMIRRGDAVLISLGGNDISNHIDPLTTEANLRYLFEAIPIDIPVRRITRPNNVLPPLELGRDHIHLTRSGARDYAHRLVPIILEMFNH